jgi:hypothetical protein
MTFLVDYSLHGNLPWMCCRFFLIQTQASQAPTCKSEIREEKLYNCKRVSHISITGALAFVGPGGSLGKRFVRESRGEGNYITLKSSLII